MMGGGAERAFALLASELARQGDKIDLLMDRATGPNLSLLNDKVRIIDFAGPTWKSAKKLRAYARANKPDLIFAALPHTNLVTAIALLGLPTPFVATVHSVTGLDHLFWEGGGMLTKGGVLFEPIAFHCAAAIGVVSAAIAKEKGLEKAYPGKARVLYNPVDVERFKPAPRKPHSGKKIISVGRLAPPKDFQTLLRAFALLDAAGDADLTIFGEGPLRPVLEALSAELGLSRVAMPGYAEDIAAHYQDADLVVASTRSEGFGNTIIEAWACGVPVVATDCRGAPRELLGDAGAYGALVPVGDAPALAQAIERVLANPPKAEVLRARAMDFSTEICAGRYRDLAREIAAKV